MKYLLIILAIVVALCLYSLWKPESMTNIATTITFDSNLFIITLYNFHIYSARPARKGTETFKIVPQQFMIVSCDYILMVVL